MALALNRSFLLRKQLLLSICYLIWRRRKQKRAKRKRTKSMWVRPLFLERRSKGLFNILIKDLCLFDHFYFLFRQGLFDLVLESSLRFRKQTSQAFQLRTFLWKMMHFDLYFSKYFRIAHKKLVLKYVINPLFVFLVMLHSLLIKNRIHLVSFKRFEFVEEKTCLLLNIKHSKTRNTSGSVIIL